MTLTTDLLLSEGILAPGLMLSNCSVLYLGCFVETPAHLNSCSAPTVFVACAPIALPLVEPSSSTTAHSKHEPNHPLSY
jgi:hypothetical protein